jgi:hypothetical protein
VLNSDIILGIKNKDFFTDDSKIAYAILTQNYDHLPCGAPVMVAVRKRKSSLACLNVFPARANNGCGYIWLPENALKFTDKQPLCETHKTVTIDNFDYSQFGNIINSVKKHGGISFVSKEKSAAHSIFGSVKSIVREYNYPSLFYYNASSGRFLSGEDDDLLSIVSFFDLTHCVPLFNMKKVDGMGISFSQVIRKHSELLEKQIYTFRLDIMVSNYKDNLFLIDGAVVDNMYPISGAVYREVKKHIKNRLPVQKDKLKQKRKKQAKKDGNNNYYFEAPLEVPFDTQVELNTGDVVKIHGDGGDGYAYHGNTTSSTNSY